MPLDDLSGGQRNRTALLQKRVQTNKYTRLHNHGGFLYLNHVSILQCLDKISLNVGIRLSGGLLPFCRFAELLDLFCNHIHYHCHTIPGSNFLVFYACEALEDATGVEIHVFKVREVQKLCYIGIRDTAHGHDHLPFLIQLSIAGSHGICLGKYHTDEVKYLSGCRAGVFHVRKMQSGSDCSGTLGFTGTGRTAHQEVSHLHRFTRGDLGVLADVDDLLRNDIPVIQLGYQTFLQNRKFSARCQLIFPFKISMCDLICCGLNHSTASLGEDRKLACHNAGRCIGTGIQLCLRYTKYITGLLDFCFQICRASLIFDTTIGVITKNCHTINGFCHVGISVFALIKIKHEVIFELIISH